jgi:hypothetical protein
MVVRLSASRGGHPFLCRKLKLNLIYGLQSILVSGSHLEPLTRFIFPVWHLRVPCCGVPSLTRGLVYNLLVKLLLGIAKAVTLGSKSHRTRDHILLSHMRITVPGGPVLRVYIRQEKGGPVIPPGTEFTPRRSLVLIYIWYVCIARCMLKARLTRFLCNRYEGNTEATLEEASF